MIRLFEKGVFVTKGEKVFDTLEEMTSFTGMSVRNPTGAVLF